MPETLVDQEPLIPYLNSWVSRLSSGSLIVIGHITGMVPSAVLNRWCSSSGTCQFETCMVNLQLTVSISHMEMDLSFETNKVIRKLKFIGEQTCSLSHLAWITSLTKR